jgi:hypothetical protein
MQADPADVPRDLRTVNGVRLLIEDVGATAVRETLAHLALTLNTLIMSRPGRASPYDSDVET